MSATDAERLMHLPPQLKLRWQHRVLHFRTPAATSRGTLSARSTYTIVASLPGSIGYGECCTMPGLLPEPPETQIANACALVEQQHSAEPLRDAPSPIRFGIESALLSVLAQGKPRWETPFTRGEVGLPIHRLVWMADTATMYRSMQEGIEQGFTCLKLKVGALPFEQETALLKQARNAFPHAEIRVDANGAFSPNEAADKLQQLATIGVNSIEQPIAPGNPAAMQQLCRTSPLPIALDEELIAHASTPHARRLLLETLAPAAIVIKPSLHGGLLAARHWAQLADELGIAWWINSALESSIGHTALAEWCGQYAPGTLHGLGTGKLFTDDAPANIRLQNNRLYYASASRTDS
ncbi:MAG: o-succinylbenzoate synthase [Akkermansiaceae bacterium]|nr:o-succinylbenzoate synthase [Akkermansiaceae bacterium]